MFASMSLTATLEDAHRPSEVAVTGSPNCHAEVEIFAEYSECSLFQFSCGSLS